jgi:hypothetical protein
VKIQRELSRKLACISCMCDPEFVLFEICTRRSSRHEIINTIINHKCSIESLYKLKGQVNNLCHYLIKKIYRPLSKQTPAGISMDYLCAIMTEHSQEVSNLISPTISAQGRSWHSDCLSNKPTCCFMPAVIHYTVARQTVSSYLVDSSVEAED